MIKACVSGSWDMMHDSNDFVMIFSDIETSQKKKTCLQASSLWKFMLHIEFVFTNTLNWNTDWGSIFTPCNYMKMTLKVNVLHIQQIWNVLKPGLLKICSCKLYNRSQRTYKRPELMWISVHNFLPGKRQCNWKGTFWKGALFIDVRG